MKETYTPAFFDRNRAVTEESSTVVARIVTGLFHPTSVVDIGCSSGGWLQAFAKAGVTRYQGFDGHWVPVEHLLIPKTNFTAIDLSKQMPAVQGFDLAICLEVAEHLTPKTSAALVHCLTRSAPVVLFSAAIPGQPGTNHINTQWPWFWRTLFLDHGFKCVDAIRPIVMYDDRVTWYYRQNLVCFVLEAAISSYPEIAQFAKSFDSKWNLVPIAERILQSRVERLESYTSKRLLKALFAKIKRRLLGPYTDIL